MQCAVMQVRIRLRSSVCQCAGKLKSDLLKCLNVLILLCEPGVLVQSCHNTQAAPSDHSCAMILSIAAVLIHLA